MMETMYVHDIMNADHGGGGGVELATLDLNLLVAFDVLAAEGNVTRAAQRMGVTQSAMSHTLRRLRETLGDPLLVRTGGHMSLTPRAESLVLPLRAALDQLRRALAEAPDFRPQSSQRHFRVAGPDLVEMLFVPSLLAELRRHAPRLSMTMLQLSPSAAEAQLMAGELDLVIRARQLGVEAEATTTGFMRRSLLRDSWSCFLRDDHPALGRSGRLTLRRFLDAQHVLVSPSGRGEGIVDVMLARDGKSRRIALRVPHFVSAPVVVAQSDLILTAPTALRHIVGHLPLACVKPPLTLPEHSVDAVWHARFHEDAGHRWFRQRVADVASTLPGRR